MEQAKPIGIKGCCYLPGVPPGNVGGETTDLLGAAGVLVHLGELLGAGLQVGVPAEPPAVAGVDVHDHVGQVEVLERVRHALLVGGLALLAGGEVGIGDQVGQGVGLDQESEGGVGILLQDGHDGCSREIKRGECQSLRKVRLFSGGRCWITYGRCTRTYNEGARCKPVRRWKPWRHSHGRASRR